MKKIPVGATIAHAYRFAFGNFLTVLRAIAVPLAIQLIMMGLLIGRMIRFMTALRDKDPSAIASFGPLLLFYLVLAVLFFMQFLAVTETALGLRPTPSWFYFPVGRKLWRLIGGFLLAMLAIFALAVALILVTSLVGLALRAGINTLPPGGAKLATAIMGLIFFLLGFGGVIFLAVRFFFLLAPSSVAEQRLGVGRSWLLSRGNFWRALLIILSVVVPFMVVQYGAMFAVAGLPPVPRGATAETLQAARMAWNITALSAMTAYWYIALPLYAVFMVLYFGLVGAAQAFAYRTLTDGEVLSPIAGD